MEHVSQMWGKQFDGKKTAASKWDFLEKNEVLGGGFKYLFMFTPTWGRFSQFDEHIFQRGWFNHQLEFHDVFVIVS